MRNLAVSALPVNRRKIAAASNSVRRQLRSDAVSPFTAKALAKPHHVDKPTSLAIGDMHRRQLHVSIVAEIFEMPPSHRSEIVPLHQQILH